MDNKKTTIAGYLILAASLATVVAHALTGGLGAADFAAVISGLTGIGLIAAKDGGH